MSSNFFQSFQDLSSFLEYANFENSETKRSMGNDSFYGLPLKEAIRLAENGWEEGAERVRKISDKLMGLIPKSETFQWSMEVSGDVIDVGRYLLGEPECFIRFDGSMGALGIIKIVANISVSAGVSKETIFLRGAQIAALVDVVENQGYRCEVIALSAGSLRYENRSDTETTIVIKHSEQHLDLAKLAFCLCHDAFSRRLIFHSYYRNGFAKVAGEGLGYPVMHTSHEKKCDIYLPGVQVGVVKDADAVEWTKKCLNKILGNSQKEQSYG